MGLPTLRETVIVPYLHLRFAAADRGDRVGRSAGRHRSDRVRPGRPRPSAVRLVLVGYHRAAEADPARSRGSLARAPEGDRAAQRHGPRRPLLLVHDDRLDDVELLGLRSARRGANWCCSTAIPTTRVRRRCGNWPPTNGSRGSVAVHPSTPPAGGPGLEPGERFDLTDLRAVGSTGAPLPADAFRWIYESVSARRDAVADLWWHRCLFGVRRGQSDDAGLGRRDPVQLPRCRRAGVRRVRGPDRRPAGRTGADPTDAVDAGRFLG